MLVYGTIDLYTKSPEEFLYHITKLPSELDLLDKYIPAFCLGMGFSVT